jgi:hypothetical protein
MLACPLRYNVYGVDHQWFGFGVRIISDTVLTSLQDAVFPQKSIVIQLEEVCPTFMEPEGALPCWQRTAIVPCPEYPTELLNIHVQVT